MKDVELFRNGSVHDFYRLNALIALEQVITSVVEKEKNFNEQNFNGETNWLAVVNFYCMQMSLLMSMRFIFGDEMTCHVQHVFDIISLDMRGLIRPVQEFTAGICPSIKILWPFASLAVRHMTNCGKIVDYISGHKQFDVASAISNFKKILSKNISPFATVKTESENIWIC